MKKPAKEQRKPEDRVNLVSAEETVFNFYSDPYKGEESLAIQAKKVEFCKSVSKEEVVKKVEKFSPDSLCLISEIKIDYVINMQERENRQIRLHKLEDEEKSFPTNFKDFIELVSLEESDGYFIYHIYEPDARGFLGVIHKVLKVFEEVKVVVAINRFGKIKVFKFYE